MNQWDRVAEPYDQAIRLEGDAPRNFLFDPNIKKLLPKNLGDKVILDAGCGNGYWENILTKDVKEICGIDYSEKLIKIAKQRVKAKNVHFQVADIGERLPFGDNSFDIIISNLVFHYIKDIPSSAKELFRILKPKGRIVFSVVHPDFLYTEHKIKITKETDIKEKILNGRVVIDLYYRPLGFYEKTFKKAGFTLEKFLEPKIGKTLANHYPRYVPLIGIPRLAFFSFKKL
jgi:ubiquinone/menaquinone biosynthesis C-methylase UbiE